MRPTRQLKIISSHVDVLDDFRKQVEDLLTYINNVLKKGKHWIDETDENQTFKEINQLLADETNACIHNCFTIAKENEELVNINRRTEHGVNGFHPSSHLSGISFKDEEFKLLVTRLDEVEKNILSLKEVSRENEDNHATLSENLDSIISLTKSHSKKLKNIQHRLSDQEKFSELNSRKQEAVTNSSNVKFDEILKELHSASDFIQSETESLSVKLQDMEKKLVSVAQTVDPLNQNFEDMSATITKSIVLIEPMVKEHSRNTENFQQKITSLESKIQVISNQVEDLSRQAHKLASDKTHSLELQSETFTTNLEEMETNIHVTQVLDPNGKMAKAACTTVVESKLKLEHETNNHAEVTELLQVRVENLNSRIQEISSQVEGFFNQNIKPAAILSAFNARVKDETTELSLSKDQILTCFTGIIYNIGKHYNPETGIYTSPCNGFYLCSVLIDSNVDENLQFGIKRKAISSGKEFLLATTHTKTKDSMVCDIGIVDMYKDDQLFVKAHNNYSPVKLSTYSHFLCILISKY